MTRLPALPALAASAALLLAGCGGSGGPALTGSSAGVAACDAPRTTAAQATPPLAPDPPAVEPSYSEVRGQSGALDAAMTAYNGADFEALGPVRGRGRDGLRGRGGPPRGPPDAGPDAPGPRRPGRGRRGAPPPSRDRAADRPPQPGRGAAGAPGDVLRGPAQRRRVVRRPDADAGHRRLYERVDHRPRPRRPAPPRVADDRPDAGGDRLELVERPPAAPRRAGVGHGEAAGRRPAGCSGPTRSCSGPTSRPATTCS